MATLPWLLLLDLFPDLVLFFFHTTGLSGSYWESTSRSGGRGRRGEGGQGEGGWGEEVRVDKGRGDGEYLQGYLLSLFSSLETWAHPQAARLWRYIATLHHSTCYEKHLESA